MLDPFDCLDNKTEWTQKMAGGDWRPAAAQPTDYVCEEKSCTSSWRNPDGLYLIEGRWLCRAHWPAPGDTGTLPVGSPPDPIVLRARTEEMAGRWSQFLAVLNG